MYRIANMSAKPTKMVRATSWDDTVEEAYRFQLAGYRDAQDYAVCTKAEVIKAHKIMQYIYYVAQLSLFTPQLFFAKTDIK